MGRKSPPPPQIIMPAPPPPPQIITDVTPRETYADASDYLRRIDERQKALEERRWNAGETPGNAALDRAGLRLRAAERYHKYSDTAPGVNPVDFGSQADFGNLGGTQAIIGQLAPKATSGSYSRDARIRPSYTGLPDTLGTAATGKDARLANAQEAYARALARKDAEQFSYPEFQEPAWADRDWHDPIKKWYDRSDKVEVDDSAPRIIN